MGVIANDQIRVTFSFWSFTVNCSFWVDFYSIVGMCYQCAA